MPARLIRVAQVVRPAEGGIRRHVSSLLAAVTQDQFACTLFAPASFKLDPSLESVPREDIAIGARTSPIPDLAAILKLSARLRERFDVVHAHGIRGALIGVAAARLAGIPAVFTAHNLLPAQGRAASSALRWLGRNAKVIAVSRAVAESLKKCGITVETKHIISNGVDLSQFASPELSEAARRELLRDLLGRCGATNLNKGWLRSSGDLSGPVFVVAGIGRLSREKGFDILISAFEIAASRGKVDQACQAGQTGLTRLTDALPLPTPRWLLLIAGAGPEGAALPHTIERIDGATLLGEIPDIVPLLRAADVVAIPSREEGQGIVALEAMAACKPVVASHVGGLIETVVDAETGLLVPPEDTQALASALLKLSEEPELRHMMGRAGRARVEERYTLSSMVDQISDVYRAMANRADK